MPVVTYAGSREELQGLRFDVPDAVLRNAQGQSVAQFIEEKEDARTASEALEQEANRRRQEGLAAKLEAERETVTEAVVVTDQATRDESFKAELSALAQATISAGAAMVGQAERAEAKQLEWEGRGDQVVSNMETAAATAKEQVLFAQASTQQGTEQLDEHMASNTQKLDSLETELRSTVQELIGPQGPVGATGLPGQGIGFCGDTDPTKASLESIGRRFFERGFVIPGDLLLRQSSDAMRLYRTADGRSFAEVGVFINKVELVNQSLSVLDQSTQVRSTSTVIKPSGGGGGLERFQVAQVSPGTTRIADAGGWVAGTASDANPQDPTSGILELQLLPQGGGESFRVTSHFKVDFAALGGAAQDTQSALLGQLPNGSDYEVLVSRGPVQAPAGLNPAPSIPAGAQCTTVELKIDGTESFLLRGGIEWLMSSEPQAISPTGTPQQPSWRFQ